MSPRISSATKFRYSLGRRTATCCPLNALCFLGVMMIRQYVVTFVDDESLVYRDAFDDSYV